MQTYDAFQDVTSDLNRGASTPRDTAEVVYRPLSGRINSHLHHESAALTSAIDDGLMPDEVVQILAGRRMAEAFPVRWGESPAAYASRAVSEMFVAYLQ